MIDYTGMFEKIASDVVEVEYDLEDTVRIKEAEARSRLQLKHELLNKDLKKQIDLNAMRAKMKFNTISPGLRRRSITTSATSVAQKAKPTGFFTNTFRKVFGK